MFSSTDCQEIKIAASQRAINNILTYLHFGKRMVIMLNQMNN